MLLWSCEVLGFEKGNLENLNLAVRDKEAGLVCVVGRPAKSAISEAVARDRDAGEVLATPENASHVAEALSSWEATTAALHVLGSDERLPEVLKEGFAR